MEGQTIITTQDVDELLISTVVRLIQRRAFPNLRNIIAKTHSADIARWFPRLRLFIGENFPFLEISVEIRKFTFSLRFGGYQNECSNQN